MLTSPAIARCFMLLCFGAAGLLLAAEWQGLRLPQTPQPWQLSRIQRLEVWLAKSPVAAMVRPVRVEIRLESRELVLSEGNTVLATYPVAIGQDSWETPVGQFAVLDLQQNPIWQHPITGEAVGPGPDNPLGSRWVGFAHKDGYPVGIHGTYEENLVGQAVSHGCVRMRDRDIQALFEYLNIGTPITVRSR